METRNYGLNDIVTRRKLVQVLGISPFALGLVGEEPEWREQGSVSNHQHHQKREISMSFEQGYCLTRQAWIEGATTFYHNIDATYPKC
jgi:hypothetical protein